MRIYLTGRISVETPEAIIDESAFPGRQARLAFAFLALSAQQPVSRDALADALWGDELPSAWDRALKSLVSKLRSLLKGAGGEPDAIRLVSGCYQLRLPADVWIDLEACARSVDVAEAAIRRGDIGLAWSEATVASSIARRSFLPGEDIPWVDDARARLRARQVRALDVLAEVWLARGNPPLAISTAAEAVGLEPFRETGYRLLMRAQALAGNRGEAIRTYDRCARVFADELGVTPDPDTVALRDQLGRAERSQTITIAVTDLVGSTELAADLGDARWAALLGRHDAIVHDAVEAGGGQVVKHLGDGFLLTFTSVGSALSALLGLRPVIQALDPSRAVDVRVGVHAGEPVHHEDDLFGLQVNIAARINALADPGEVLVSSVIRDLAPPGDFAFELDRTVTLKGVPGEFTLYCAARP